MSTIEEIRADMAEGIQGEWCVVDDCVQGVDGGSVFSGWGHDKYGGLLSNADLAANARRIARVPHLERIALAAENVADAFDQLEQLGCQQSAARLSLALARYREATT